MTRTLRQLTSEEQQRIIDAIHQEAEKVGWSRLNFQERGKLYRQWEEKYDLTHATIKDRIMKGFDAQQQIPKTGEAKIREELGDLFRGAGLHVNPSAPLWTGRERADFLIGFHKDFLTHVVEVERADSWAEGLRQVLWYRAAYFQEKQRQIQPMLILFGAASSDRFDQIKATCNDNHIVLCTYKLRVGGNDEPVHSVTGYLQRG
ncbi:MAG: hypothetical protein HYU29_04760 [Chloroflexi bacterium]|nr:hypothetical protein [Chloroflexota bacterium]